MRYWLMSLLALSVLSTAQAKQTPFTVEELLAVPEIPGYSISGPDGTIAWAEVSSRVWNIYVAKAPDYVAKRLTNYTEDDGARIRLVGFVSEGKELLFSRGETGYNPSHLPDPTERVLLSVSLDKGNIRRIKQGVKPDVLYPDGRRFLVAKGGEVWSYNSLESKPTRLFTVRGSVKGLTFSPDGSKISFVSDRSRYKRGKYAFVGVFDIKTRRITYMEPGVGTDGSAVWSSDSKRIAFIRVGYEPKTWRFSNLREGALFSIMVADVQSGEGRAIWTSEIGYGNQYSGVGGLDLSWLSNDMLVFPYEKTGWRLLYGIPASGGKAKLLTPGKFEISGVDMSPDRSEIIYWANSERDLHRQDIYSLSLKNKLRPKLIGKSAGKGTRGRVSFGSNGSLLYFHAGPTVPARLMVRTKSGKEIQLSTGPKPGDPITRKAVAPEVVSFKSLDGMEISAILWRPKNIKGKGHHPVIVRAHGGSRAQVYPVWEWNGDMAQYFVSQGYFVLSVNYRSGTGYGLNFREPDSYGGSGAGDVQDFIAAAGYLKDNVPEIDPDRMAVFGHSYGGHIVTNVLARSDVYAAGISSAGVGDWVVEMEMDSGGILPMNIPDRLKIEQLAYDSSAISKIDQWGDESLLFIHGDNDPYAAMQQTIELYLALQKRGKKVDALIMPGESHFFAYNRNKVKYMKKMDAFLEENMK